MASNTQSLQPLSGGYDYKFVEEPSSDLKCLICLCVARGPLQHGGEGCGKIFCGNCITEYQKKNNKCPNCREDIVTFKDVRSERDIQSLKVQCENEGDGCEWVGEIRSLEDHLKTCGYTKLFCPNRCYKASVVIDNSFSILITVEVFRKDLQKHLNEECKRRQYTCPHCNETGEYQEIAGFLHRVSCPKMEIDCPNKQCKNAFLREDTQNHLDVCPYKKISCKYKEFGCSVEPLRKDLPAHEGDDRVHLHMTMDTLLSTRKELKEQSGKLKEQSIEVIQLKKKNDELQGKILANFIQMNQNHPTKPIAPFSFKITRFAEKKEKGIEYYSPPFFTHPRGYKMAINIDSDGHDRRKSTHVSVWVFLMRGEYDDKLEFPFKGTITFELLNQLEDSNHHKKSYTYDGTEKGNERVVGRERAHEYQSVHAFIPHSKLGHNATKNCQYLKDDCLVFRIHADVPSYKPWLQCTA